jgi:hypothetical protein
MLPRLEIQGADLHVLDDRGAELHECLDLPLQQEIELLAIMPEIAQHVAPRVLYEV